MNIVDCYRKATAVIPGSRKRAWLKRINFVLRVYFRHRRTVQAVEEFFDQNALRQSLIEINGFRERIYQQQVKSCFYNRSEACNRLHYLKSHFALLEQRHTPEIIQAFYTSKFPQFAIQEQDSLLSVKICYDHVILREGLLWFLLEFNGVVVCKITFWLAEINRIPSLCIGALQGGKYMLDVNRDFTKEFYGLRPQNMALHFLRAYAKSIDVEQILCLPKEKMFCQNIAEQTAIDELWQEQNAQPLAGTPTLNLPLETPRKPLEEIASKKRSMYKKRFDFLDKADLLFKEKMQKSRKIPLQTAA